MSNVNTNWLKLIGTILAIAVIMVAGLRYFILSETRDTFISKAAGQETYVSKLELSQGLGRDMALMGQAIGRIEDQLQRIENKLEARKP